MKQMSINHRFYERSLCTFITVCEAFLHAHAGNLWNKQIKHSYLLFINANVLLCTISIIFLSDWPENFFVGFWNQPFGTQDDHKKMSRSL